MRPASIVQFERIFLGALAVGLVSSLFGLADSVAALKADPATAGLGASAVIGMLLLTAAAELALWYFAAQRRSVIAKWLISAVWVVLTCLLALSIYQGQIFGIATVIYWLGYALRTWAVSFLFKPDADAWFAKKA